jgi:NADH dehydrogenase
MKICITGANSSVGQNLLKHLANREGAEVIAGVRSEKAFADLPQAANIQPTTISYDSSESLNKAMAGADCVIHLAGILIESKHSNYASANVAATAAVVAAAKSQDLKHIIFISVVGASPDSSNAYFRSKGAAEQLVANSGIASTILRTPILLGPGTAGAWSLLSAANNPNCKVLGGGHYCMRPLDTDDLSIALTELSMKPASGVTTHELVGPQSIPYRELIQKTAIMLGKEVEVGSVPVLMAKIGAALTSTLKGGGITPTVIDVITSDEVVEQNADSALGLTLSTLDETLQRIIKAS